MARNPENNDHQARGISRKPREEFGRVFKVTFPADQQFLAINQAHPLSNPERQRIRRGMRRDPDSGRKRR